MVEAVKIPLEQWDTDIKPYLQSMEFDARWIRHYANNLSARCKLLSARPPWETNAKDEIERTVVLLKEIAADLSRVLDEYEAKTVVE